MRALGFFFAMALAGCAVESAPEPTENLGSASQALETVVTDHATLVTVAGSTATVTLDLAPASPWVTWIGQALAGEAVAKDVRVTGPDASGVRRTHALTNTLIQSIRFSKLIVADGNKRLAATIDLSPTAIQSSLAGPIVKSTQSWTTTLNRLPTGTTSVELPTFTATIAEPTLASPIRRYATWVIGDLTTEHSSSTTAATAFLEPLDMEVVLFDPGLGTTAILSAKGKAKTKMNIIKLKFSVEEIKLTLSL